MEAVKLTLPRDYLHVTHAVALSALFSVFFFLVVCSIILLQLREALSYLPS
jgi:hypothetical protein